MSNIYKYINLHLLCRIELDEAWGVGLGKVSNYVPVSKGVGLLSGASVIFCL